MSPKSIVSPKKTFYVYEVLNVQVFSTFSRDLHTIVTIVNWNKIFQRKLASNNELCGSSAGKFYLLWIYSSSLFVSQLKIRDDSRFEI